MKKRKIVVICGPTSSGKTSLATQLCKETNAEIISADSRQIYKYMDIGTGKIPVSSRGVGCVKNPGMWIINGINIWGYDLIEPGQYFSSYDFAKYAMERIQGIREKGKKVIVVGGTGFYIDTLTGKSDVSHKKPNPEIRNKLNNMLLKELQAQLHKLNPEIYEQIDQKNPVRLIRAIERELSEEVSPPLPQIKNTEFIYLGLNAPRNILYSRADNWVEEIWNNGLIIETKTLIDKGYKDTPQMKGLVYKTANSYIEGDISEPEAKQQIKFDLHAYIRRQQTWFKRNTDISWLDITDKKLSENALNIVKSHLDG